MSLLNSVELTNMSDNKTGSIDIIMGCMFSGKSTELIRLANRYKVLEMKVLIVNHKLDNRYSEDAVATHSDIKMDCLSIDTLSKIKENYRELYDESQVIIIEEAQFFEGLYDFVLDLCEKDCKNVIVVGLDGDSNRNMFGDIIKLIPVCDSVKKLYGLCVRCKDGTKACFTKRLVENNDQVFIGTSEFQAVCRKCYIE
jgi:thymidine kinase